VQTLTVVYYFNNNNFMLMLSTEKCTAYADSDNVTWTGVVYTARYRAMVILFRPAFSQSLADGVSIVA
jgi:hypothetical protein